MANNGNAATVTIDDTLLLTRTLTHDLSCICGCGQCSMNSFLQKGCPKPSQIPALSLPYANVTGLNDIFKQIMLGRLYLEFQNITEQFSKLKSELSKSLSERRVTVKTLSGVLTRIEAFQSSRESSHSHNAPLFHDRLDDIKKSRSLTGLLSLLPNSSSFLEYHVLERIANELGTEPDRNKVTSYKAELEDYCKRGIFDCPTFSPGKSGQSNFILEVKPSFAQFSLNQLLRFNEEMSGVFQVAASTICLCNVSKVPTGNVQLVYRIPHFVREKLLPLSSEQKSALRALGILEWTFFSGPDASCDQVQLLANQFLAGTDGPIEEQGQSRDDNLSSDDDEEETASPCKKMKPAPGKKTRGRVKIPMEYIKNKLRRYTTFSKRKSNIMKKAYELSTLTGTQVMLMVASETGHVYTFATPKLQPMITSEAGKALIQTCLHQPDAAAVPDVDPPQVRMSSTGYEETELGGFIHQGDEEKSTQSHSTPSSTSMILSTALHPLLNHHHNDGGSSSISLPNEMVSLLPASMLQSLVSSSSTHSPVHIGLLPPPPLESHRGTFSPHTDMGVADNGRSVADDKTTDSTASTPKSPIKN